MKRVFVLVGVLALLVIVAACGSIPSLANNIVKMVNGIVSGVADSGKTSSEVLKDGMSSLRITVDPGHGGIDIGATGTDTGTKESVLNLQVSELVAKLFTDAGANVLMTRTTADVDYTSDGDTPKLKDMNSRAKLVKKQDPQVLVSIHMNMFTDRSVSGPQVFYQKGNGEGLKLAQSIQDALNTGIDSPNKRSAASGDFFMLRITESPSVIVECGFLSNHDEEKKLLDPDYQEQLANCIYKGVCNYLGVK
jgi:N-acetylmuramoyl-L-alanine amidase